MSKRALAEELRQRIATLGSRIEADRAKFASGTEREKAEAAGELADLQRRQSDLQARLVELEKEPQGGAWQNIRTSIEEDMLDLETAFSRWARKYY